MISFEIHSENEQKLDFKFSLFEQYRVQMSLLIWNLFFLFLFLSLSLPLFVLLDVSCVLFQQCFRVGVLFPKHWLDG